MNYKTKIREKTKPVTRVVIKYSPLLSALFLTASYLLGVTLPKDSYYKIAVYLYESINSGLWNGIILMSLCAWHKLCGYNWMSSIFIVLTSVFNIIAKYNLDERGFNFYCEIYGKIVCPFIMSLILIYFVNAEFIKNPKKNDRQHNRLR